MALLFDSLFVIHTFSSHFMIRKLTPELPRILAERLAQAGIQMLVEPPLSRVERGGRLPLTFAQERLWFSQLFNPSSKSFNLAWSMRSCGTLNLLALQHSFNKVVQRHETLRTRFVVDETGVSQQIDLPYSIPVAIIDLSDYPLTGRVVLAQPVARTLCNRRVDLERGPIPQVSLIRLAPD